MSFPLRAGLTLACFSAAVCSQPAAAQTYTVIDPFASIFVVANTSGQVGGFYTDPTSGNTYGFLTGTNGIGMTSIDPFSSTFVDVTAVDASGQAAGFYLDPTSSSIYGFVTGANGVGVTQIDPSSSSLANVTGASSGIGEAAAFLLAQSGAKVVVAARRQAESVAVVEKIKAAGGAALFVLTDVSRLADHEVLVGATLET